MEGTLTTKDYIHFTVISDDKPIHTFEGAKKANRCLVGDSVSVQSDGSVILKDKWPNTTLAGYLELDSKTTYGLNKRGHPFYLFIPLNTSYPPFMVACSEKDRSHKRVAIIDTMDWEKDREFPRGSLKTLLGPVGDLESEEEALLWNACPWKGITGSIEVDDDDCPKRTPVTEMTFNIDPEGCKDIDDCVSFEEIGDHEWWVTITISDVASCVKELGAVDCMASVKGQTLYRDGYAIRPMLPPSLSEDECSLLPGKERRGVSLSFLWRLDEPFSGDIEWSESIVKNQTSYTYDTVPEEESTLLKGVTSMLAKKEITDPHEWIEVLMKFYNCEAAKLLLKAGKGVLRRHKGADIEKLEAYIKIDPALRVLANTAGEYCLVGDPDIRHVGLGTDAYCHATSPIRRYADLMNQRIIKQVIRGNFESLYVSIPVSDLNMRAKACRGYERDRIFLKCLLGTGQREFDAIVLEVEEHRIVLWIPAWQQRVKVKKPLTPVIGGTTVRFRCAMNVGQRRWKDRMVIELI